MTVSDDPFRHHPRLRDLVIPAAQSKLRDLEIETICQIIKEHGGDESFVMPDEIRDRERAEFMKDHWGKDIWVFAYGSLIWDPAIVFSELRRAHAPDYSRQFILVETGGGRGSIEAPGIMAALDHGDGCDGLVLRVPADLVEEETYRLWRRERIGPAYLPAFIPVQTDFGEVQALTFIADHEAQFIQADMPYEQRVRHCATGKGFLGTSRAYIENLVTHFNEMGIRDDHLLQFWADVCAHPESA